MGPKNSLLVAQTFEYLLACAFYGYYLLNHFRPSRFYVVAKAHNSSTERTAIPFQNNPCHARKLAHVPGSQVAMESSDSVSLHQEALPGPGSQGASRQPEAMDVVLSTKSRPLR